MPKNITEQDRSSSEQVEDFLKQVIDITSDHAAAYKPNLGFFEALGAEGLTVFEHILDYIPEEKVVIADAKRGDISSTAEHYAKAFFEQFDVDSITLNPLMGFETLSPFLHNSQKGIFVLALTSNPGAEDILLAKTVSGQSIAAKISTGLRELQSDSTTSIGLVVGATKAGQLTSVISNFPEAPLLIPGVGKQGGSIQKLADVLKQHEGMPLINSSRSIIYAGQNREDWQKHVAKAAKNLKEKLSPITEQYV